MKTFARLIRRYVLATAGIILVVVALLLGMTIYAGVRYNDASDSVQKVGALAEALHPTADGLQWDAAHTPAEWMHGYAWAMVLDDTGNIRWNYALPDALNHAYTTGEVAGFARWYLDDYPVFCWAEDYGLFVIGLARGSLWKCSIYTSPEYILNLAKPFRWGLGCCCCWQRSAVFCSAGREPSGWKRWLPGWMRWPRGRPYSCLRRALPGNWPKS